MTARLSMNLNGASHGSVLLDDLDISKAVTRIKIESRAGHGTNVELTLACPELFFEGDVAAPFVPDRVFDALVALGWTPPDEPQP